MPLTALKNYLNKIIICVSGVCACACAYECLRHSVCEDIRELHLWVGLFFPLCLRGRFSLLSAMLSISEEPADSLQLIVLSLPPILLLECWDFREHPHIPGFLRWI